MVEPSAAGEHPMKHGEHIAEIATRTRRAVAQAAKRGEAVIALGGDHAISLGTIAGAMEAHESLGLIYIDAHPDCTTHETTESGNVHGMIVSSAMGEGHSLLTTLFPRAIDPQHVLYLGIKDIDEGERELIRARDIPHITALDIATRGLAQACDAIDRLAQTVDKVWVSLDLDSIDERFAPGVAMTSHDGLTRREIVSLAHYIGKVCDVAGVDVVEMVSEKDVDGITAKLAIELLARFLGGQYGWYERYMEEYRAI